MQLEQNVKNTSFKESAKCFVYFVYFKGNEVLKVVVFVE
jgi:hypothetical protein